MRVPVMYVLINNAICHLVGDDLHWVRHHPGQLASKLQVQPIVLNLTVRLCRNGFKAWIPSEGQLSLLQCPES